MRTCLDSADAPRVSSYRGSGGIHMSVVVQPMLDPEAAGVAFSADPVSGAADVVRISAVRGLGDRVVDGTANPEEWQVVADVAVRLPGNADSALTPDQAVQVAEVAQRAAEHFGGPQDIEWAWCDGEVHVLQSRPITTLPVPPTATLDGLGWEKDAAHYAELFTPFGVVTVRAHGRCCRAADGRQLRAHDRRDRPGVDRRRDLRPPDPPVRVTGTPGSDAPGCARRARGTGPPEAAARRMWPPRRPWSPGSPSAP